MNPKSFLLPALLAALTTLAACGSSTSAPTPAVSKVGLIVTGTITDGGWNQLAYTSLQNFAQAHDHQIAISQLEGVAEAGAADAIRQFDSKGFNVIIGNGHEYQQAAIDLTKANAIKAKIIIAGGDADNPAFQTLAYDLSGASYQLGVIAARISKTGKLGFIAGEEIPSVTSMKRGFEAGAKSVNPSATVSAQYTGWDDPSKAKQQAQAFFEQNIDIIMQNVDSASKGIFEAVKEHNKDYNSPAGTKPLVPGEPAIVYTFGANSDQNHNGICDDYMLASAVIKMDLAFDRAISSVRDGSFKGGLIHEDLASGVSIAVLNPKLLGKVIDPETQKLVDQAAQNLISGQIKIPQ